MRSGIGDSRVLPAVIAAAVAGGIVACVDALWNFAALAQYLPELMGRLGYVFHLALSYSIGAAVVGGVVAIGWRILQSTEGPQALATAFGGRLNTEQATMGHRLSLMLVVPPVMTLGLALGYQSAYRSLFFRKHLGLVVASSVAVTALCVILGVLASFVLSSVLGRGVRADDSGVWGRRLSMPALGFGVGMVAWGIVYQVWPNVPVWTLGLCALPVFAVSEMPRILRVLDERMAPQRTAFSPWCVLIIGIPLTGLSLAGAYRMGVKIGGTSIGAHIAPTMIVTSIALFVSGVVSLLAGRWVCGVLGKSSNRLSLRMLMAAVLGTVAVLAGIGVLLWWHTLVQLPLRPWIAVLAIGVLARMGLPYCVRWNGTRKIRRLLQVAGVVVGTVFLFLLLLLTGNPQSVRKAQVLHSALGGELATIYRKLGDWDRDGYSRWLGGGDCDDGNAKVHPGRDEIPDDGIDNNCLGGDVSTFAADVHDPQFSATRLQDFNVIFISIDTIRADHLGAYGYHRDTTPNLDALANSGTLFANAWAHAPSTRYSIPALLTGRFPLQVHYKPIRGQWPGLHLDNVTIAEVMKRRGWRTGAILNYWYFDEHRNMNQGFDVYDNSNKRLHRPVRGEGPAKTSGSSAKEQSDKALEFVATHETDHGDKPFFLWVHYYDPHYDYEQHPDTPVFGTDKVDGYDHEIAYTDHHIGRLINGLKARGLFDKTVIVVTGDHGEGFGEHGIDLHGYHLYAAQTKVPLIIRIPDTEPSVVSMPAAHVDVLPTLANLVGAAQTEGMLGRSLLPVILGEEDREQERYVYQQLSYENHNEYRGLVSKKCHVLFNVSPNLSWELYHIDTDPMEERDRIDSPGECDKVRAALEVQYDNETIPEGASAALLPTRPSAQDRANELGIVFGTAIRLVKVDMPTTIARGKEFSMELTWAAQGAPPAGWKVFAHFETRPGRAPKGRFTADHRPTRPFSWWRSGQYIRYPRTVQIANKQVLGHYDLWLGVYKGAARMPVTMSNGHSTAIADNRVLLGTMEVVEGKGP